jgi:hypothetical protein
MAKKLAARIIVFAFTCIWILGLISFALLLYTPLFSFLETELVEPFLSLVSYWYVATTILVGVFVAYKGLGFVGRWVKNES